MDENTQKAPSSIPDEVQIPAQRDLFSTEEEEVQEAGTPEQNQTSFTAESSGRSVIILDGEEKNNKPQDVSPAVKVRQKRILQCAATATAGQMLAEARRLACMDLTQAAEITRIRKDYIEALEKDDKGSLPSSRVFIHSYIRTLAEIYQLDDTSRERIMERLQEEENAVVEDVPEKILEHIGRDGQISEEEAQRVRLICIYGGIVLCLLISLAVTSIAAISYRNSKKNTAVRQEALQNGKVFDSKKIETLLAPQMPDPVMLEVPKKKP